MRHRISSELAEIDPFDQLERTHLMDAAEWVKSGAPLYRIAKPATPAKHLVVYFAVIHAGQILLVEHKNAQLWLPTGGHVDPDEDPRQTVVRESKEELGLTVELHDIGPPRMVTVSETVGLTAGHTDVTLWYAIFLNRTPSFKTNKDEFDQVQWFALAEVPVQNSDPNLARFLSKLTALRLS